MGWSICGHNLRRKADKSTSRPCKKQFKRPTQGQKWPLHWDGPEANTRRAYRNVSEQGWSWEIDSNACSPRHTMTIVILKEFKIFSNREDVSKRMAPGGVTATANLFWGSSRGGGRRAWSRSPGSPKSKWPNHAGSNRWLECAT